MLKKFKNEKGVSLITLGVMIVMLIIISQVAIYNSRNAIKLRKIEDLKNDIELLDIKVAEYYLKREILPLGPKYTNTSMIVSDPDTLNPNDDINEYYVVDLRMLSNISLNYGRDYEKLAEGGELEDIYIINARTHTIYYPKGVEIDGKTYYRKGENFSKIDSQPNNSTNIKIDQNNKDWTNGDVELTIMYGDKLSERKVKYIENGIEKEQNFPIDYGATLEIKENQWVIATAKDPSGNRIEKKIQITNIDKEAPKAEAFLDTNKWINYDLSMKLVMTDNASGIKLYQFSDRADIDINSSGWKNLQEEKKYLTDTATVTKNGIYYMHMIDLAGNIAHVEVNIRNIDKKNPIPTLKLSNDKWTNQDIKLFATGQDGESGIKYYYLGKEKQEIDIDWTDLGTAKQVINYEQVVAENEIWYFYVKDEAGNVAETEINIGNIDKENPIIVSLEKSTNEWTQKLTLEGKANDKISGINAFAFSEDPNMTNDWIKITPTNSLTQTFEVNHNGTYYFYVKDEAGNIEKNSIVIDNIDTVVPELNMDITDEIYCKVADTNIEAIFTVQYRDSESGIKSVKYGVSGNVDSEPTDLIDITNNTVINLNLDVGIHYLWVIVEDNAGNLVKNIKKISVVQSQINFYLIENTDTTKKILINYGEGLTENRRVLINGMEYINTDEVIVNADCLIVVHASDKHGNEFVTSIEVTF